MMLFPFICVIQTSVL